MTQSIIVTIVIDLPDGATVGVTQGAPEAPTPVAAPPRAELPPPMPSQPDEPPHPAGVGPGQFPPAGVSVGTCSQGHPWKTVPGGVSQRTGKAYSAFTVCDDRDHGERPR